MAVEYSKSLFALIFFPGRCKLSCEYHSRVKRDQTKETNETNEKGVELNAL